ncbi:MAG: hypothetical protein ACJAQT_005146 [Akkermansiaceae bacterium]|jgi:hypothetical protein
MGLSEAQSGIVRGIFSPHHVFSLRPALSHDLSIRGTL